MLAFLKDHPFAVEAFFKSSMVVTFAVPKEQLESLLPQCLELDTFENKWGFIAVAMVQTTKLRPKGFPEIMGHNFFLIGYRIFVRYTTNSGKRLRGLYILKSETNKRKMEILGNVFTHYNYTTTDINLKEEKSGTKISSKKSDFYLITENSTENNGLPLLSPFKNWKEARRYAGPLPFTFTFKPENNQVLIIEGVRQNWVPQPVKVLDHSFSFLDQLNLKDVILANAFVIKNIPYYWKKGKKEVWKQ